MNAKRVEQLYLHFPFVAEKFFWLINDVSSVIKSKSLVCSGQESQSISIWFKCFLTFFLGAKSDVNNKVVAYLQKA